MKTQIPPDKLYRHFKQDQMNEPDAIDNFIYIIKHKNEENRRIKSVLYIGKILKNIKKSLNNEKIFKTLEEIFISDSNETMQLKAGINLIEYFLEKAEPSLIWKLKNDIPLSSLIKILTILKRKSPTALRKIITLTFKKRIHQLKSKKLPTYNGLNEYITFFNRVYQEDLISGCTIENLMEIFLNFKILLGISKNYNLNKKYSKFFYYNIKEYGRCEIIDGLITKLNLYDLGIRCLSKINGLDYLKQLRVLEVCDNDLSEIKFPKAPINLENSQYSSKKSESFQKLKALNLGLNSISEIKNLSHLSNLEKLNLGWNEITKIKGIQNLKQLKQLDLSHNRIYNIENLENLKNLEHLNLSHNYITEIIGLDKLHNLSILYLQNNHIKEIKGLENLKNLRILYLNDNRISEIKGLGNLPNLTAVYLNNNEIRNAIATKTFPEHCCVFLDGNPIENKHPLNNLKKSRFDFNSFEQTMEDRFGRIDKNFGEIKSILKDLQQTLGISIKNEPKDGGSSSEPRD